MFLGAYRFLSQFESVDDTWNYFQNEIEKNPELKAKQMNNFKKRLNVLAKLATKTKIKSDMLLDKIQFKREQGGIVK